MGYVDEKVTRIEAELKKSTGLFLKAENLYEAGDYKSAAEVFRSVAFPSISTGVYGYPVKLAAKVAVKAVKSFAHQFPDVLDYVCWTLLDENTRQLYEKEIRGEKYRA